MMTSDFLPDSWSHRKIFGDEDLGEVEDVDALHVLLMFRIRRGGPRQSDNKRQQESKCTIDVSQGGTSLSNDHVFVDFGMFAAISRVFLETASMRIIIMASSGMNKEHDPLHVFVTQDWNCSAIIYCLSGCKLSILRIQTIITKKKGIFDSSRGTRPVATDFTHIKSQMLRYFFFDAIMVTIFHRFLLRPINP